MLKSAPVTRKATASAGWIRKVASDGWEVHRLSRFAFMERRKHNHKYRLMKDGQAVQYFDSAEELYHALEDKLQGGVGANGSLHIDDLLQRLRDCGASLDNSDEEPAPLRATGRRSTSNHLTRNRAPDSAPAPAPALEVDTAHGRHTPVNGRHPATATAGKAPDFQHQRPPMPTKGGSGSPLHSPQASRSPLHDPEPIDADAEKPPRRPTSARSHTRLTEEKAVSRAHRTTADDPATDGLSDSQPSPRSPGRPLALPRVPSTSAASLESPRGSASSPRRSQSQADGSLARASPSTAALLRKGSADRRTMDAAQRVKAEHSPRNHMTPPRAPPTSPGAPAGPMDSHKDGPPPPPVAAKSFRAVGSSRALLPRQGSAVDTSPTRSLRRNSTQSPSLGAKKGSIRKSGTYSSPENPADAAEQSPPKAAGAPLELAPKASAIGPTDALRKRSIRSPVRTPSGGGAEGPVHAPTAAASFRTSSREPRGHGAPPPKPHAAPDPRPAALSPVPPTPVPEPPAAPPRVSPTPPDDSSVARRDRLGAKPEKAAEHADRAPGVKPDVSPMVSPRMDPTPEPDKRLAKAAPAPAEAPANGLLAVPEAAANGGWDKRQPPPPRAAVDKGPALPEAQRPVAEKEKVIAWYYDDLSNTWTYKELEVRLAQEMFAQGGMRKAFHMLICDADGKERPFVAKLYNEYAEKGIIAPDDSMFGSEDPERMVGKHWALRTLKRQPGCEFEAMLLQICCPDGSLFSLREFLTWHRRLKLFKIDVEMQGFCQTYAAEFNKRNPPKPVVFLDAFLIVCVNRPQQPIFACEPLIKGDFIKFNNNCGQVQARSMERNTPQAFSHFTYWFSRSQYIIVDIQGVNDTYTDPQVHSVDRSGFGMGNLGQEGIDCFFKTHRCNNICVGLGLVHPHKEKKAVEAGVS